MMDAKRLEMEMRRLAEDRITRLVGEEEILLTKAAVARICNKSQGWVTQVVALGRLPTVTIGTRKWIQRPVVVEALVKGV